MEFLFISSFILMGIANCYLTIYIFKKFKFYDSILNQAKIYYNKNLNKGDQKND